MIEVPFMKLHGAENDFLLTWSDEAPSEQLPEQLPEIARRICARTTGIGADGWMLVTRGDGFLRTRLFNSDGSEPEISGNGTRCAAAFGLATKTVSGPFIKIVTAAGEKVLEVIEEQGTKFVFEMNMGLPKVEELHTRLSLQTGEFEATTLNVGNPQCAIFVKEFPEHWQLPAAEAEGHPRFRARSNVSFVRVLDPHTLDVVFYERGAGETKSSGTGSTGAAVAAILRGDVESPVEIRTPAGSLRLRWTDSVYLTGPAEIVGEGRFFLELRNS
jgi:diaminopimelate epimerase